ncbi:hypothetical protein GQ600_10715 [Phytophthora cactorum]|nr:hypothetical protein GQ600_10715 [Phytophthora cactorum]
MRHAGGGGGGYVLLADWCVKTVKELKQKGSTSPVLHYLENHYAAYVHGWRAGAIPDEDVDMQEDQKEDHITSSPYTGQARDTQGEPTSSTSEDVRLQKEEDVVVESQEQATPPGVNTDECKMEEEIPDHFHPSASSYGAASPSNPENWSGDIEELRCACEGPTIHHGLKTEIYHILDHERLSFLVNTVSQLSVAEQQRLLEANLNAAVVCQQYMQEFQIPEPIQVRSSNDLSAEGTSTASSGHHPDSSESEYILLSDCSALQETPRCHHQVRQILQRSAARSQAPLKHLHDATPDERIEERGTVVNAHHEAVPLKKGISEDPTRILLDQFEEVASKDSSTSTGDREKEQTLPSWPIYWNAVTDLWRSRTRIPFPVDDASVDTWKTAVRNGPQLLLEMHKAFKFLYKVMQLIAPEVITLWTAAWREWCWIESMRAWNQHQREQLQNPRRARKFSSIRRAKVNRAENWVILEAEKYGGDSIRKLCALGKEERLGNHIICVQLYAVKKNRDAGETMMPDDSLWIILIRHRRALHSSSVYRESFYTSNNEIHWEAIDDFMGTAVVTGHVAHSDQY